MNSTIILLLSILFFECSSLLAQQVTRGPYLQLGTPNSMVIRWRTDVAEIGKIRYGTALNNLMQEVNGSNATTEHELKITGLQPATIYYYEIATASNILIAAETEMYFKTSPLPGTIAPYQFWVIGDFGDGSPGQLSVRESYKTYTPSTHTDAWIWLGDNAYGSGTQQQYQDYVFDIYPELLKKMVAWPCPGNHDYGSIDLLGNGPYFDIFTLPTNGEAGGLASGTEGYYSFDYGNVHFISLNSENLLWTALPNNDMTNWLKNDLEQNDKDWVIAYWHQPPYSKGSHDSDGALSRMELMRSNINPVLEQYGVDLVLCGHSHNYERSYMLHGHYGRSNTLAAEMIVDSTSPYTKYLDGPEPNKGTVYNVVGCSGKLSSSGTLDHPVMTICTKQYHGSLVLNIEGKNLHAKFLTSQGNIEDEYVIEKKSSVSTNIEKANEPVNALYIKPQPVREQFEVTFSLAKSIPQAKLALYDLSGKEVKVYYTGQLHPGERKNFSTSDVATGLYVLQMSAGGEISSVRMQVVK